METKKSPYLCHVFVCINDRKGERRSCADQDSVTLAAELKRITKERGWAGIVRVSKSGCLGQCEHGPNVMIYPGGVWFHHVSPGDIDRIIATVQNLVEK